jgi:hypothetical protein
MSTLVVLAQEAHKTLWYPTILGVLAVLAGVALFCGSVYGLLATNLGARLGFLVAFTVLAGFMVVLTTLWMTTASPLNTLRGRVPSWKVHQIVDQISDAKDTAVHGIDKKSIKVDPTEAANVKAAVDQALVTKVDTPTVKYAAADNKFARYDLANDYMIVNTYEIGGSHPNPLSFQLTHTPKYAVVEFCGVVPFDVNSGLAPPAPTCAAPGSDESKKNGFMVLERDLGSVRVPPIVAFGASSLLFALGLLMLHWRERDEQELARASAPSPVPAKA